MATDLGEGHSNTAMYVCMYVHVCIYMTVHVHVKVVSVNMQSISSNHMSRSCQQGSVSVRYIPVSNKAIGSESVPLSILDCCYLALFMYVYIYTLL